jgi:acyl-CoA synthetase (AMP-forming)/AMP-acid ligase II
MTQYITYMQRTGGRAAGAGRRGPDERSRATGSGRAVAAPVLRGSAPTVDAALRLAAEQFGDVPAFVADGRRFSYREWARTAGGAAGALASAGVRPGDVVCLALPSSIDFAIAYMAAAWLGATVTAVDPRLGPSELEGILGRVAPTVTVGAEETRAAPVAAALGGTALTRPELVAAAEGAPAQPGGAADPDGPAVIAWTSGTTGAPKGAWFSHRALESAAHQSGLLSAPYDRRLLATPFAHVGFLARVWDQMTWAITSVLTPMPWTASEMLALLEAERVTVGQGVPTQWEKVLALPHLDDADLSSLRVIATGATRVPPELVRELRRRLGCPVLVRYACSEVPIATGTAPDDPPEVAAETVGRPVPGVQARIMDEAGAPVPAGSVGRLQLRSPGAMAGYWKDQQATADALVDGRWVRTGDLAHTTARGDLVIVGRSSEMYIRSGYNVHPLEIERVLMDHPAVEAAAVIGLPAPVVGEVGVAFVVPARPDPAPSPDELRRWCRDRLADYKVPDRIELVADLPRNSMLKVDKRLLRGRAEPVVGAPPS